MHPEEVRNAEKKYDWYLKSRCLRMIILLMVLSFKTKDRIVLVFSSFVSNVIWYGTQRQGSTHVNNIGKQAH